MVSKQTVNSVLTALGKKTDAFFSEDQFKLLFALELKKQLRKSSSYDIIPEYCRGTDYFDLLVIDLCSTERTIIEFKYKTEACSKPISVLKNHQYEPRSQKAFPLGQFDCWADIERNEYYVQDEHFARNAFFILLTNDTVYINGRTKCGKETNYRHFLDFSMANGLHPAAQKCILDGVSDDSAGATRKRHNRRNAPRSGTIWIKSDYDFVYEPFGKASFHVLVVETTQQETRIPK